MRRDDQATGGNADEDFRQDGLHGVSEGCRALERWYRQAHDLGRSFSGRVLTTIVIDDRQGATGRIEGKVRDVEQITGKKMERKR